MTIYLFGIAASGWIRKVAGLDEQHNCINTRGIKVGQNTFTIVLT